jgi:hypothetical protein
MRSSSIILERQADDDDFGNLVFEHRRNDLYPALEALLFGAAPALFLAVPESSHRSSEGSARHIRTLRHRLFG